jgi:DNA-binding MarR family transcriptional regulator
MTATASAVAESSLEDSTGLDLEGLSELLGFHLRLAQVAMYRDFAAAMNALDLTQQQWATLQLIGGNPAVSQVDLAATLGTDPATMMSMVDRLEQRDFLVRKRSKADRRRQELSLTPEGEAIVAKAKRIIAKHERKFKDRFTPEELKNLLEALTRIHGQT